MPKRAVVLAGGGSCGAYQLGVWQALRELELPFDIVTGASVGALNGALMVQGDYELARRMWQDITAADVLALPQRETPGALAAFLRQALAAGGADVTPLERTLSRAVDEARFRASPIQFGMTTVALPSFKPLELTKEDIPPGMLVDYLMASAACYPAFQARVIDGVRYIDGGYHDNMPMNMAVAMGAQEIIAVDLESIGQLHPVKDRSVRVRVIRPYFDLGNFLRFEPALCRRNIQLGYLETMKAFGVFAGRAFTFRQASLQENYRRIWPVMGRFIEALGLKITAGGRLRRPLAGAGEPLREGPRARRRQESAVEGCLIRAGEQFGLDPTEVYTAERFNERVLAGYSNTLPLGFEAIRRELDAAHGLRALARRLARIDRAQLTAWLTSRLLQVQRGESAAAEVVPLALLLGNQLPAALYLCCLMNLAETA